MIKKILLSTIFVFLLISVMLCKKAFNTINENLPLQTENLSTSVTNLITEDTKKSNFNHHKKETKLLETDITNDVNLQQQTKISHKMSKIKKQNDPIFSIVYKCTSDIEKKLNNSSEVDSVLKQQNPEIQEQAKQILNILVKNSNNVIYTELTFNSHYGIYELQEEDNDDSSLSMMDLNIVKISEKKRGILFYDTQNQTITQQKEYQGINVRIQSDLNSNQWELIDSTKVVAGYPCQLATTTNKDNQKVEAWFSKQLPYGYGPAKYGGLEGVILELNINDGLYLYTAEKVEKIDDFKFKSPKSGKLYTEEEFKQFKKKHEE